MDLSSLSERSVEDKGGAGTPPYADPRRDRPDPASWVRTVLNRLPFHEARINHEIALQSRALKLRHQDPADRFLAATAMVYQLTLVTADKNLFSCRGISVLRNR
jgi:PIN domain nuclease of toxin-antitoxin system